MLLLPLQSILFILMPNYFSFILPGNQQQPQIIKKDGCRVRRNKAKRSN